MMQRESSRYQIRRTIMKTRADFFFGFTEEQSQNACGCLWFLFCFARFTLEVGRDLSEQGRNRFAQPKVEQCVRLLVRIIGDGGKDLGLEIVDPFEGGVKFVVAFRVGLWLQQVQFWISVVARLNRKQRIILIDVVYCCFHILTIKWSFHVHHYTEGEKKIRE